MTAPWLSGRGDIYPGSVSLHNGILAYVFVLGILILDCLFDYLGSGYSFCSRSVFRKHHVEGLVQLLLSLSELENDSAVVALGLLWAIWGYSTFFSGQSVYHFDSSCQNR